MNYNREQQKKSWKRIKDGTVGTAEPDLILGAIPKIDGNARNKILGISFGQHSGFASLLDSDEKGNPLTRGTPS